MNDVLGTGKIRSLLWRLGLPVVLSMVLQAIYNVVDTAFVINMGEEGATANLALTYAFPVQILMIAVGVGTGIGINALLAKSLGQGDTEKSSKICGNSLIIVIIVYLIFLFFGLFGAEPFIAMQAGGNAKAIEMGTEYLRIVCVYSLGSIGFTAYERFLQASGRSLYSTISQVAGAVTNIVGDYLMIFVWGLGVAGAAYATVIGQFVSLFLSMAFHYALDRKLNHRPSNLKPSWGLIKGIYRIGLTAMIMQALLSVMMLTVNLILGTSPYQADLLVGSFGVYYKIQQLALFAAFGMSNTIISVLSYNYGAKDALRSNETVHRGVLDAIILSLAITVLFEIFARPIAELFALSGGDSGETLIQTVETSIRIASISYVFMGFSVGVQGVLQSLGRPYSPLVISICRLLLFLCPFIALFIQFENGYLTMWWSFLIAEALTSMVSYAALKMALRKDPLLAMEAAKEPLIDWRLLKREKK